MKLREQIDMELNELKPTEDTLQEILKSGAQRPLPGRRLLLCAAVLAAFAVVPASAHMFGSITKTTPITDENRELLNEPDIAVASEAPAEENYEEPVLLMDNPEKLAEVTEGIIREVAPDAFLPDTVTVLALSPNSENTGWVIPELLTANGFTTIFTRENGEGWELKKGETLHIQYEIGSTAGTDPKDPKKRMEIGYIADHVFYTGELMKEENFSYTLAAPKDGTYYLYNINSSDGKIYITGGVIH